MGEVIDMSIWTCPYCEFVNAGTSCEKCDKPLPPEHLCFLQTPTWVTEALLDREQFTTPIWEPCAGAGAISNVLEQRYPGQVFASDKYDHGVGLPKINFLTSRYDCASVITNPPYRSLTKFVRRALSMASKVALVMPTRRMDLYLCNWQRCKDKHILRPKTIYPLPLFHCAQGGDFALLAGWYVWEREYTGDTVIKWID
jgi:hypothetical protein